MLKYFRHSVSFTEVPDEMSVYIPLTGCKIRCKECNSKWLWEFSGTPLTPISLLEILRQYPKEITCICIGGGENDLKALNSLFEFIHSHRINTCWYTGLDTLPTEISLRNLDYVKIGSFKEFPITDRRTNQRFYKIVHHPNGIGHYKESKLIDLTSKFQH